MKQLNYFLAVLTLCIAAEGLAQQHPNQERGFPPSGTMQLTGPDTINIFNGSLGIRIPVGQRYPVAGNLNYGLNLVYNGQVWDRRDRVTFGARYMQSLPTGSSNAGLGWRLSLGELIPPSSPRATSSYWVYEGSDGNQHLFYPTLHPTDPVYAGFMYTRDSSYLRMKKTVAPQGWDAYDLEFPDGTIHQFDMDGRLWSMRDRHGNTITLDYQMGIACPSGGTGCYGWDETILSDPHGRVQRIRFAWDDNLAENGWLDRVQLTAVNGTTSTWEFDQAFATISRGCHDDDPETGSTVKVALLSKVNMPDGTTYEMPQYAADNTVACSSGMIRQMQLPTRGRIEWDYQAWIFTDVDAVERNRWVSRNPGVAKRRMISPYETSTREWIYTTTLVRDCSYCSPFELVNSVTDPAGNRQDNYFSAYLEGTVTNNPGYSDLEHGLPFTRRVADATGTRFLSTVLSSPAGEVERTFVRYEQDAGLDGNSPRQLFDRNRRLVSQRTVYATDAQSYKDVTYSRFDGLGHYRQTDTAGNFDAYNVQQTTTEYNPAAGTYQPSTTSGFTMPNPLTTPWVLSTYGETTSSAGGVTEKRQYCFDANTGALTRERLLSSTVASASDLLRVYTYSGGNLTREQRYGGDNQAIGVTSLCTMTLPATDQFRLDHTYSYGAHATSRHYTSGGIALSHYAFDRTIDQSTGAPLISRDTAGLATHYEYDALGRRRWEKPVSGGWTETVYTAATATATAVVEVRDWNQGGTVLMGKRQSVFDGFGRTIRQKHLNAAGTWSTVARRYHAGGALEFESSAEAIDSPVNGTTYRNFDAYGRAGEVVAPDGTLTQHTYKGVRQHTRTVNVRTGGTATTFSYTSSSTIQTYDGQGRLWRVTEPSGPAGANVTTTYNYDQGSRLTQVTIAATEGTQYRYFTYDRRGLLTQERHPEKGVSGNSTVSHSMFDASGRALRRVDGAVDLRFAYDRAERLTHVSEGSGRVWKVFTYATANGTNDYRKGKLWSALRHNYLDRFALDMTITETYVYGGVGGRVSRRDTVSNDITSFTQTFTYNDRGLPTTLGYPSCTADCTLSGDTITNTYTNGYLTSVPRYASQITYHPNGIVNDVTFASGAHWIQTNDAASIRRPLRIQTTGTTANWSSGDYRYDAGGNIMSIGSDYYLYDAASRVVKGTASAGTASQQYTLDSFGNVTAMNAQSLPTSASTNRLTTASYDASGNVTAMNGLTYEYDALGMMRAVHDNYVSRDVVYLYTADDERIWTYDVIANTSFWRLRDVDGKVLTEYINVGDNWTGVTNYVYRGRTLLGTYSPQRTYPYMFFAVDHLGTPRRTFTSSGSVMYSHAYYPYGDEATSPYGDGEIMKFTGHERDLCCDASRTGFDYMHARHYSPFTGRFMSVDPIYGIRSRPITWNRYSYAAGNPVRYTDPDGRQVKFTGDITITPRDASDVSLRDSMWEFFWFSSGVLNAVSSNWLMGAGRKDVNIPAYEFGQLVGDASSIVFGIMEVNAGIGGIGLGFAAEITVVGAPVGVGTQLVSGAMILHGSGTIGVATTHFMSGIKQRKYGKHGTFRGRQSKRANDSAFDRVCDELGLTHEQRQILHSELSELDGEHNYQSIMQLARELFR